MKRLFVGCRVRVVSTNKPSMRHHIGKEGWIVAPSSVYPAHWHVNSAPTSSDGVVCSWASESLEPIQDPGHQVISWESMKDLWQPQGEVA